MVKYLNNVIVEIYFNNCNYIINRVSYYYSSDLQNPINVYFLCGFDDFIPAENIGESFLLMNFDVYL